METLDWYNMWGNRNFPYRELLVGDILYWFNTPAQRLVWKTEVIFVDRYPYTDKRAVIDRYNNSWGSEYADTRPDSGYFLGYKIKVIDQLDIPKPSGSRFDRLGWLRVDNDVANLWFNRNQIDDSNILDDIISSPDNSVADQLSELNQKMQNVSPERIDKLISTTIRKDTKIINALKRVADFRCQFPDCGQQIKKRGGGFYVEVAHIKPVAKGGQSVLGNLIVLCPNHHKEFDFGQLAIVEQTTDKLSGLLNDRHFEIKLTTT
ncbi:MAG: HNH endonuclease [Pseudomonadota bacterium]